MTRVRSDLRQQVDDSLPDGACLLTRYNFRDVPEGGLIDLRSPAAPSADVTRFHGDSPCLVVASSLPIFQREARLFGSLLLPLWRAFSALAAASECAARLGGRTEGAARRWVAWRT